MQESIELIYFSTCMVQKQSSLQQFFPAARKSFVHLQIYVWRNSRTNERVTIFALFVMSSSDSEENDTISPLCTVVGGRGEGCGFKIFLDSISKQILLLEIKPQLTQIAAKCFPEWRGWQDKQLRVGKLCCGFVEAVFIFIFKCADYWMRNKNFCNLFLNFANKLSKQILFK